MIPEHDPVALARPLPEYGLEAGDLGVVVFVYPEGAYEVEFMTAGGWTVAVVTLKSEDVRPVRDREVPHARELVG